MVVILSLLMQYISRAHSFLKASGADVGLPDGQVGNSEVGHMNIGAGRVVMQDLPRLNAAVKDGSLAAHPDLIALAAKLRASSGTAHVMGLLSPGGVHALAVTLDHETRKVRHYLNGELLSSQPLKSLTPAGIGHAQIGNWNAPRQGDSYPVRNLHGRIDELPSGTSQVILPVVGSMACSEPMYGMSPSLRL